MDPIDDIRGYCASAVLAKVDPPRNITFPPPGEPSRASKLQTEAHPGRCLVFIDKLSPSFFKNAVLEFQSLIPDAPLPSPPIADIGQITIPAPEPFNIPNSLMPPIKTRHNVMHISHAAWYTAFITLERIMSVLHDLPDTWGVRELAMSSDPIQGFIPFSWSDKDIDMELPGLAGDCRTLFAIMEPWVLTETDFHLFANQRTFANPIARKETVKRPFTDAERLWGMIYDRCHRLKCPWFVLSTYNTWSFGVFSEGWSTAWVTPPMSHDSQGPTILQCLVYWVSSAMEVEGGWKIDKVPREDIVQLAKRPLDADAVISISSVAKRPRAKIFTSSLSIPQFVQSIPHNNIQTQAPLSPAPETSHSHFSILNWRNSIPSPDEELGNMDESNQAGSVEPTPSLVPDNVEPSISIHTSASWVAGMHCGTSSLGRGGTTSPLMPTVVWDVKSQTSGAGPGPSTLQHRISQVRG